MWKRIKDFIVVTIGVVSGIFGIISFIWSVLDVRIEKFKIVIDLNYIFGNINLILVFLIIMLLCLCYIVLLIRARIKSKKTGEYILLQYNKILSIFQKKLLESVEARDETWWKIIRDIIYEIQSLFRTIYNKSIRVQIKIVEAGVAYDNDASVRILCSTQSEVTEPIVQKIQQNSEFLSLVKTGDRFFTFSTKNKKSLNTYISSDPRWRYKYSSLLVLPIKKAKESGVMEVVGFLCLDSLDKDAFDENVNDLLVPLLDTIAGYLYLALRVGAKEIDRKMPNNLLD